ncbi:MAG TPA: YfhO family protein [Thermoanaerobaculia bacterium]|jgi:hypothetical protein|nr:YfhO family protein [Thermoanaerobaculia bacterium]
MAVRAANKRQTTNAIWLGGLVFLTLLAYADILLGIRGLFLEDLIGYHFPMKHIVREAIRSGELLYWNPLYSAGQPLAANPAYELFYPPQWLVYVLPYAYAFQLHIILHFVIAAIGAFFLIRSFGVKPLPSAVGAAAFIFSGPYLSLSAKLPILFAVSWMPLVLLLVKRLIESFSVRRLFAAAAAAGMQLIIGEPTMVMQTWALIGAYALVRMVAGLPGRHAATRLTRQLGNRATWQPLIAVLICGVLAALIAAVQLLPAVDFARDTVRARGLPFRSASNWSFPLERIQELPMPRLFLHLTGSDGQPAIRTMYRDHIVPFLGNVYCGAFFVILSVTGIFAAIRGRWWFLAAFGGSVIAAMGDHTPLMQILYDAGLVNAIRYPEKFILAGALALAIWSAIVIEKLIDGDPSTTRSAWIVATLWTALTILVALSAKEKAYFWTVVARAAAVLIVLLLVRARRAAWSAALLVAVALGELWLGTRAAAPRMPRAYFDPPALENDLKPFGGARIFHDAQWSAWMGNELSNEYFFNVESDRFWWVDRNGEFLNMPAAWGDHPIVLEQDVDYTSLKNTDDFRQAFNAAHGKRDPSASDPFLRMANAGVRLSFRTLDEPTNKALAADPSRVTPVIATPINTNPRYAFATAMERIDSNDELGPAIETHPPAGVTAFVNGETFLPASGEVLSTRETRNTVHLDVRASGRAFLVLSVTGHKYWSATIDSKKVPIVPTNVAFQGIVVPAGMHSVELRYRNPLVATGGGITILTLLGLGAASLFKKA